MELYDQAEAVAETVAVIVRSILSGLTSDAAAEFIAKLPGIETLMPKLSFAEVAGEAVSPNALRQRRYREKQAALRGDVTVALQAHQVTRDGDGDEP